MGKQLTFDEIKVGDEMTPFARRFMQENVNIVMAIVGSVPNWHVDPSQASAVSDWKMKPDHTALPGVMTEMGVSEFVINWLGDHKPWFLGGRMDVRLIAPVQIHVHGGGDVIYTGKVAEKKVEGDKKIVVCQVKGEQEGIQVMDGVAQVAF
ncbi:MAG: hypothetical protein OS130_04045 [Thermodesulfobacteriota bacterium]|jgi:hypothetical protein|nr:MAG: hypothetical protein OS130_04045 [Thermodesulfobacteriota bacterium]